MKNLLYISSICLAFILSSCKTSEPDQLSNIYIVEAPQNERLISLQNLTTREIVRCHSTEAHPASECAEMFEKNGYVRFSDIPSQTAEYDLLQTNTYPSRVWRKGEKNPRW